jgi:acetylornithine deacetylase
MDNIVVKTKEAVDLLTRMIEIPSFSREEGAVADLVFDKLQKDGLEPHRIGNNVWCVDPYYDALKPTILLDAHLDTVKPVSAWTKNPFKATVEGDCIFGLGSNDDGASVVSLMQVYKTLIGSCQSYNLVYSASCEEEVSGSAGLECVLPLLPPIHVGLVGEPTNMQPAIAEKGLMVLDAIAYGKAGHAARDEGENAIYKAIADIGRIKDLSLSRVSPLLGPVKMTVTMVHAGTQHNVIPDQCTFVVDVRSNELYSNKELYDYICLHVSSDIKARSFRLNSSSIDAEHPLVLKTLEMGLVPFGSPTLSNQALMPFPSMKMGPGCSSRSHTANEFIKISEIDHAIRLYLELLDGLKLEK